MSVNEKMTAIADSIRAKTGGTEKLNLDQMASAVGEVYDAGYAKGQAEGGDTTAAYDEGFEAGKQAEYYAYWEIFQNGGARFSYTFAFHGLWDGELNYGWNDETYNPIYPLKFGDETHTSQNFAQQVFYYNTEITDTKVDILVYVSELKNTFVNAYYLKTIRKLKFMRDDTKISTPFTNCRSLENLTIEGVIGSSIDLSPCPLTPESMKSVITHLKPDVAFAYTCKFNDACWAALEADSTPPSGETWAEYLNLLGWNK